MNKSTRIAVVVSSILLLAMARTVTGAIYGFTTWELGRQTNTIQSGELIGLRIVNGTASNIGAMIVRFSIGGGNAALTNNLYPTGVDFYANSSNSITNGFYTGNTIFSAGTGLFIKSGGGYEVELGLTGDYQSGTNVWSTVTFQGYNPGPTNILVPVQITSVTVGRSGGTWGVPGTWSPRSTDYGNSSTTWVEIMAIPEPSAMVLVGLGIAVCGMALRLRRKR
jgi:hypothetical protein